MNQNPEIDILQQFYKKLSDNVKRSEKKLEYNSVLLTLYKITSNKASKLLNDSGVKSYTFPISEIKKLEDDKSIRMSDNDISEYVLTAYGIWKIENARNLVNTTTLLDFIQNSKNFSSSARNRELSDKDKIILLSMVGIRTFSIQSPMDLSKSSIRDYWLEIFRDSHKFLIQNNFSKKNVFPFEKHGNEHPVSYAMRRANDLPKRTYHIFCFSEKSKNQYYLYLDEDKKISRLKLKKLLGLIIRGIDKFEQIHKIQDFCLNLAYEKSKYVIEDFSFIKAEYDEIINETLRELYLE